MTPDEDAIRVLIDMMEYLLDPACDVPWGLVEQAMDAVVRAYGHEPRTIT